MMHVDKLSTNQVATLLGRWEAAASAYRAIVREISSSLYVHGNTASVEAESMYESALSLKKELEAKNAPKNIALEKIKGYDYTPYTSKTGEKL